MLIDLKNKHYSASGSRSIFCRIIQTQYGIPVILRVTTDEKQRERRLADDDVSVLIIIQSTSKKEL